MGGEPIQQCRRWLSSYIEASEREYPDREGGDRYSRPKHLYHRDFSGVHFSARCVEILALLDEVHCSRLAL